MNRHRARRQHLKPSHRRLKSDNRKRQSPVFRGFSLSGAFFSSNLASVARALQ